MLDDSTKLKGGSGSTTVRRERLEAEVTRKNLAEVQARLALAAVGARAAREKRIALNAAVAVLNDGNTRQHLRVALQQHEQKTTQLRNW